MITRFSTTVTPDLDGPLVAFAEHLKVVEGLTTQLNEAVAQRDMAVSDLEAAKAELRRIYEEQAQVAEFKP